MSRFEQEQRSGLQYGTKSFLFVAEFYASLWKCDAGWFTVWYTEQVSGVGGVLPKRLAMRVCAGVQPALPSATWLRCMSGQIHTLAKLDEDISCYADFMALRVGAGVMTLSVRAFSRGRRELCRSCVMSRSRLTISQSCYKAARRVCWYAATGLVANATAAVFTHVPTGYSRARGMTTKGTWACEASVALVCSRAVRYSVCWPGRCVHFPCQSCGH